MQGDSFKSKFAVLFQEQDVSGLLRELEGIWQSSGGKFDQLSAAVAAGVQHSQVRILAAVGATVRFLKR